MIKKWLKIEHCWQRTWIALGALSLLALSTSVTCAQQTSSPQALPVQTPNFSVEELYRAQGELLVKGQNMLPVGELKVKTYRLEEVKPSKPIELGRGEFINSAVRLVVTLDAPLIHGAYTIWINDVAFDALPGKDNELSVLFLGLVPFENGAEIAVSNGLGTTRALSTLPERLQIPARLKDAVRLNVIRTSVIQLRSITTAGIVPTSRVRILITTPADFGGVRNAAPILQIGKQDIGVGSAYGHKATFELTAEQFASAQDGGMVIVKFRSVGGLQLGRLNKSRLDK